MKVAILDDFPDAVRSLQCFARLQEHEVTVFNHAEKDPAQLAAMLDGQEAIILTMQRSRMPRAVIERLSTVRLISQIGSKWAHIDVDACNDHGIAVAAGRPSGQNVRQGASPTAELTWALLLSAMRHVPHEVERLKAGVFQTRLGRGLYGKTLGIYAYGRLGSAVARYGRAFDMRVVCLGRSASLERAREDGFETTTDRATFFNDCDVVSLHLPLTPETKGIVTAGDLALMKSDAVLVNTSRAGLITPGALERALELGRPGQAAVDVYEEEPVLHASHPLLQRPNAICTPHLGYVTRDNYEALFSSAIDQVLAFAKGAPINIVNPQALPA